MASRIFSLMIISLLILMAYISIPARAQGTAAISPPERKNTGNSPLSMVRVIVLAPMPPPRISAQAQKGVAQAVEKIMTARRKAHRKRRRLFTLPNSSSVKSENKIPSNLKNNAITKNISPSISTQKAPAPKGAKSPADRRGDVIPFNVIPFDQRLSLAQELLTDIVIERLHDRLSVTVTTEKEVEEALNKLHLTPADITEFKKGGSQSENGRRLCAALNCQALIVPRLMQCAISDGLTRDVRLFARIHIETLSQMPVESQTSALKSSSSKRQKVAYTLQTWPAFLDVAGASSSERGLFRSQYKKKQEDCIRDAAQQAANLLMYSLRTGELIPFMRANDRLAIAPVLAPAQADKLLFTPAGRRVQPVAVRDLAEDVSPLFTPDLLPLTADRIVDASEVKEALAGHGQELDKPNGRQNESRQKNEAVLWTVDHGPDMPHVLTLARKLRVDYILLTRISDIELSEGQAGPALLSASGPTAEPLERSANVEAAAVLVRVSDGVLLWQDRGSAITKSVSSRPQNYPSLIHDATRFALIELQRRLRRYRAGFEE